MQAYQNAFIVSTARLNLVSWFSRKS